MAHVRLHAKIHQSLGGLVCMSELVFMTAEKLQP